MSTFFGKYLDNEKKLCYTVTEPNRIYIGGALS